MLSPRFPTAKIAVVAIAIDRLSSSETNLAL